MQQSKLCVSGVLRAILTLSDKRKHHPVFMTRIPFRFYNRTVEDANCDGACILIRGDNCNMTPFVEWLFGKPCHPQRAYCIDKLNGIVKFRARGLDDNVSAHSQDAGSIDNERFYLNSRQEPFAHTVSVHIMMPFRHVHTADMFDSRDKRMTFIKRRRFIEDARGAGHTAAPVKVLPRGRQEWEGSGRPSEQVQNRSEIGPNPGGCRGMGPALWYPSAVPGSCRVPAPGGKLGIRCRGSALYLDTRGNRWNPA